MRFFLCILAMVFPVMAMADIASTVYTDNALSTKADDSAVVHKTGNETISGTKTFSNASIILEDTVDSTADDYSVPNTMWVNDRIEEARGVIPVGGADGTDTAQIWIE